MNFKTIFPIGLCSVFLLIGCSDPERETITKMKAHLKGKNPEFRNIDGRCGEVSYLDTSGKRSEYKHFITYEDKYYSVQIEGEKDEFYRDFNNSWSENCKGNFVKELEFKNCMNKGVKYYKNLGSYPTLSTGESADLKIKEKCKFNINMFD